METRNRSRPSLPHDNVLLLYNRPYQSVNIPESHDWANEENGTCQSRVLVLKQKARVAIGPSRAARAHQPPI